MARKVKMKLVRTIVGISYPHHPQDVGVVSVPAKVAQGLLDTKQAMPICGVAREIQIAALCSAAHALGVTLKTGDHEIVEAAREYGAHVTSNRRGSRTPPSDPGA